MERAVEQLEGKRTEKKMSEVRERKTDTGSYRKAEKEGEEKKYNRPNRSCSPVWYVWRSRAGSKGVVSRRVLLTLSLRDRESSAGRAEL